MSTLEQPVLRILSWNIYRNYRPAQIAGSLRRFIDRHEPDLLLIQEAPVYDHHRFADLDLFAGYHAFYAPVHEIRVRSARLNFESTGQLILSRLPYDRTDVHELPSLPSRTGEAATVRGTVTRNVAYVRFRLARGGTLGVYNVHLENRAFATGRAVQVRHLLDVIQRRDDRVVVVGGDFNTFLTAAFETCLRLFDDAGFVNLFSAVRVRLLPRLDYFMVRGAGAAEAVGLRGRGSDHAPILAILQL